LIVAGGFQAGRSWAAGASALLLALGFLGLAHALLETTVGKARHRDATRGRELRMLAVLGGASLALLLGLSALALWLPGSAFVDALRAGIS
jgi:MFS-type transporter involved in bile tolerance (Atg22 family)